MFKKSNNDLGHITVFLTSVINGPWLSVIGLAQPIIENTLVFLYAVGSQADKRFFLLLVENFCN
ncbi:MAG: hypothetical protein NTW93_08240 [Phycisphaerae bacterium]|nr:hypothetical protein [Phycisphaerae bacterium]